MSITQPLITMVVPVRNRPQLIGRLLDCIDRELPATNFLTIIVDNGSTDTTAEVVRDWLAAEQIRQERVTLLSEPIAGAPAARNRGLEATTTPYIMFFDSDDTFRKGHIARIERYLSRRIAEAEMPRIVRWSVAMANTGIKRPISATPTKADLLHHLFHASLATQRYCASTDLVRKAGGWNNSVEVWNDLEAGIRLLIAADEQTELIAGEPLVEIEARADSITGLRWADRWEARLNALKTIEDDLRHAGRRDLLFAVDARRMILAATIAREGKKMEAASIRRNVIGHSSPGVGWRLKAVYAAQRLLGRGGSRLGMFFS